MDITEAEYVPPLEKELLTTLREHGRIVEFGRRAVFNYDHVSVLIKNLPNDAEAVGLLRDSIATLAESMEAKVCSLHREHLLRDERDKHLSMLLQVQDGFKRQEELTMKIMDDLTRDMQSIFDLLGLSEGEEAEFNGLLSNALESLSQLHSNGIKVDSEFNEALKNLQQQTSTHPRISH